MNKRGDFWRDAATAGLAIGLAVSIIYLLNAFLKLNGLFVALQFVVLIYGIHYFTKQRSVKLRAESFSFGNAVGFIMAAMMLSGLFEGFTTFIISTYITPEVVDKTIAQSITMQGINPDSDQAVLMAKLSKMLIANPIFVVLSSMFGEALRGGIIGLFIAPFVRHEADPFAVKSEETENNEQ